MAKMMAVELPKATPEALSTTGVSTELLRLMESFPVAEPNDRLFIDAAAANLRESTQGLVDVFAATMAKNGTSGLEQTDVLDTFNAINRDKNLPDRGTEEAMLSICTFDYDGSHILETVICAPVNGEGGLVQPSDEYKVRLLVHLGVLEPGQTMEDLKAKLDEHEHMGSVPSTKYENIGIKASRDGAFLDVVQKIIPLCEDELLQTIVAKVESLGK